MDIIIDEISDDSENLSEPYDEMSQVSDDYIYDQDDPDYVPGDYMDDTEPTQASPPPSDVQSSAESVDDNEQEEQGADAEQGVDAEQDEDAEEDTHREVEERPIIASQRSPDDDGQNCSICFEPWTNSSEHRLVSLRCGHLFGRSCISRWLKGQNARCPQCNARARKSEIRNIYAKAVKVLDSSERDKALQDLARETELRRAAEINAAQERVRYMMSHQECERLKKELIEAQKQLHEYRSGLKSVQASQSAKANSPVFSFVQNIDIAKDGGCRIVDSCDLLGMLLISQPSSNPLFPGYGFRKISTHEMKATEFVLVHQKPIRDMAFHMHDGLVLTASLDKSLRITNILSNTIVQTYHVNSDVWSCAWDSDNAIYFYGGLKTGEVYLFDIRMTDRHVQELQTFGAKTPVVSLQYLRKPFTASHKFSGPIVGKLSDCALYQKTDFEGQYKIVPTPALGPFTCLSSETSGHFLVSCRPSPKQPRITHTLCDFITAPSGELVCCPIKTFTGGRSQVQLTRSKLLSHPDKESSVLICAGDEDARGALVWDGSSGECLGNLITQSPVLDITGINMNHKSFMTALTDKSLRVYRWNGL